jgi:hypothetical protein
VDVQQPSVSPDRFIRILFLRTARGFGLGFWLFAISDVACAQSVPDDPAHHNKNKPEVHWLYGAYVPKGVPLRSLNNHERLQLYVAQSFTSPGIYLKTAFLAGFSHLDVSPSEWGGGSRGLAKRMGSEHTQSLIQNSLSALGNGVMGYEPRYDRCRCEGGWRRTRHALVRNVLTYDRSERSRRPQLPLYLSAAATGMISDTWLPDKKNVWSRAGHNALVQLGFGSFSNMVGEFAPEIKRLFKKDKKARR